MITCKTTREIDLMRIAGHIVALTHQELKKYIVPGITTKELDDIAESFILSCKATPSFKGYNGFPGSICTSVNEEVVHGIPAKRVLKDGDIISIDIGAKYNGYHGDSAWTYTVGNVSEEVQNFMRISEESLFRGLEQVKPGARLSNISNAIQQHAEMNQYSIVREFVGHGIGKSLHEAPEIPNYGLPGKGPILQQGMVLAIEPMVNLGRRYVRTLLD